MEQKRLRMDGGHGKKKYIEIMVRVAQLDEFIKNFWLVHLPWAYANYTSINLPKPFPKDF